MSTLTTPRYTAADLLRIPDGDHYELVDGELVETETGGRSSWISGRVFVRVEAYASSRGGWAFPDNTAYQCFEIEADRVRRPDGSYIAPRRLPGNTIPEGHIPIAPDLAVEVISPNDIYYRVEQKVREYLDAGVRMVWLINPDDRTVRVFSKGEHISVQLGPDDELTGGDVMPGFACKVGDLFPPAAITP
jgi:Uma2 family endonuclease